MITLLRLSARSAVVLAFALAGCAAPVGDAGPSGADEEAASAKLNPKSAPGGNFDLSVWQLQEPVGSPGSPRTTGPDALVGAKGYESAYFFTDPADGAMTFWDPENGVHTPNSSFARSELREMNRDGSAANWPSTGTHKLSATVKVTQVPSSVCVGQIHIGSAIKKGLANSTKPLLELYVHKNGDVVLGLEDDPAGGQTPHTLANVPIGTSFSYVIQLKDDQITITIDGKAHGFAMPRGFVGYGEYFKIGDYDQTSGSSAKVGATVKVYALAVSHTK